MRSLDIQRKITDYYAKVRHLFIPYHRSYANKRGLSEKILRRSLEKQGWIVWRGGIIGITKEADVYPNVRRKYELLHEMMEEHREGMIEELEYLCKVHHGMPDFLCFRRGVWKFVECKLGHEQLSSRQKHCIRKLQHMGFTIEVHKLVEDCTKTRKADVNLDTGEKEIIEKQLRIKKRY